MALTDDWDRLRDVRSRIAVEVSKRIEAELREERLHQEERAILHRLCLRHAGGGVAAPHNIGPVNPA